MIEKELTELIRAAKNVMSKSLPGADAENPQDNCRTIPGYSTEPEASGSSLCQAEAGIWPTIT